MDLRLNGKSVSEGAYAAVAAELHVPAMFLSGDDQAVADARANIGPIETVTTKEALSFNAGIIRSPGCPHRRELKTVRGITWCLEQSDAVCSVLHFILCTNVQQLEQILAAPGGPGTERKLFQLGSSLRAPQLLLP